ncbi:MAG TPA: type II toxin-antitoxin system prevent-host-death family antitoxin [Gemmatimonadales bacterium]|nr:type II toxin-antitoxin system prevent-host-death family antitoxin [Gemmatimonadales bacterium]
MDRHISASEANRWFSRLLREVREGHSYVITSHGRPVARLAPPERDVQMLRERKEAYLAELAARPTQNLPRWTREQLYDDALGLGEDPQ